MESVVSIVALAVSVFALLSSFTSNKYEKISFDDQVYERFAQMWFDMDHIFIEHPEMHKYFYRNKFTGEYAPLNRDDSDYEMGICIAELFSDVFQYTSPLEKYLLDADRESYNDYKRMIMNAPIMSALSSEYQWHSK